MTTVLISGSRSIKHLPEAAIASIDKIMQLGFHILVGDAYGVDSLVLEYLHSKGYDRVTIYYAKFGGNGKPRLASTYPKIGVKGSYSDRDRYMCSLSEYGLAIWDGKSPGTKQNIDRVRLTKVIIP
ncbi:MAG: hypothetical protein RLZZ338_1425 [Cyanobacteriota bacterium]|jgi:adenine-specific DNA-methyltransferase